MVRSQIISCLALLPGADWSDGGYERHYDEKKIGRSSHALELGELGGFECFCKYHDHSAIHWDAHNQINMEIGVGSSAGEAAMTLNIDTVFLDDHVLLY